MLWNYFFLAFCTSIDSLGIGITYGLKGTKISFPAKTILFLISLLFMYFSLEIGTLISSIFSKNISNLIGSLMLIGIGLWVFYQSFHKPENNTVLDVKIKEEKIFNIFIKSFGITIQIIRNPSFSDLDNSKNIDAKEALFLGFALSFDSLSIGISSSIMGINSILFPLLSATFQLFFLSIGRFIGKELTYSSHIPESIWNKLSGILLIIIGIIKSFIL